MVDSRFDLTGSNILIVDDVYQNLDVLGKILEDAGYQLQVATSGQQALEVVARALPDLILLDVMMPGMNGFETCRRLKGEKTTRDIPVIFLTALNEVGDVVEGFQAGGVDYMTKPFQQKEVLIRIQAHLERARLRRELAEQNSLLDRQVEDRTRELESKARELEGRDRVSQQLLTVHSLHETLDVILEGITSVVNLNRAVIYLEKGGDFVAEAAMEAGILVGQDPLPKPSQAFQDMVNEVRDHRKVVSTSTGEEAGGPNLALIPISRGEDVLGLIEVETSQPVEASVLQTLSGFALQTAVAIIDAQAQDDAVQVEGTLHDVSGHMDAPPFSGCTD
jgi:DNA-binding response OmpR family regulator